MKEGDAMNEIRLGLIGLGSIADIHLEAIRETKDLWLAAVSIRNVERISNYEISTFSGDN